MSTTTHTEKFHYKGFDVQVNLAVFIEKEVEEWFVYLNDCHLVTYADDAGGALVGVDDSEGREGLVGTALRDPARVDERGRLTPALPRTAGRTGVYDDALLTRAVSTPFRFIKPYIDFTIEQRKKSQLPDVLTELRGVFADNG